MSSVRSHPPSRAAAAAAAAAASTVAHARATLSPSGARGRFDSDGSAESAEEGAGSGRRPAGKRGGHRTGAGTVSEEVKEVEHGSLHSMSRRISRMRSTDTDNADAEEEEEEEDERMLRLARDPSIPSYPSSTASSTHSLARSRPLAPTPPPPPPALPPGRLSERQQDEYVKRAFPFLQQQQQQQGVTAEQQQLDPFASIIPTSFRAAKESRFSPHIMPLGTDERSSRVRVGGLVGRGGRAGRIGLALALQHAPGMHRPDVDPMLPLYLSSGTDASLAHGGGGGGTGVHFPALPARSLSFEPGATFSGSNVLALGHSASGGLGFGSGSANSRRLKLLRGLQKAQAAMAAAEIEAENAQERQRRLYVPASYYPSGSATERKRAARSPHRSPARLHAGSTRGALTARRFDSIAHTDASTAAAAASAADDRSDVRGSDGAPAAASDDGDDRSTHDAPPTFLTESSPFTLPEELEAVTVGVPWPRSPPPPADENQRVVAAVHVRGGGAKPGMGMGGGGRAGPAVPLDARGQWAGPTGAAAGEFQGLVDAQLAHSRWNGLWAPRARQLFLAKCADRSILSTTTTPSSSAAAVGGLKKRQQVWVSSFLQSIRRGRLGLSGQGLGSSSVAALAQILPERTVGPERIVASTSLPTCFTHLDLSNNFLGDAGAEVLARALVQMHLIQSVNVASNGFTGRGVGIICGALKKSKTIQEINLSTMDLSHSSISFSAASSHPTASSPSSSSSSPTPHAKNFNHLGPGLRGAQGVRDVLLRCPALRTLHLAQVGLGLLGAEVVAIVCEGVANSPSIAAVNLARNELDESDAPLLCSAMARAQSTALATLQLQGNQLGSLGLFRLGTLLQSVHSLTHVDVSANGATLSGWLLLSHALSANTVLDRLLLDENPIGSGRGGGGGGHGHVGLGSGGGEGGGGSTSRVRLSDESAALLSHEVRSAHLRSRSVSPKLALNESLRTLSLNGCSLSDPFVSQLLKVLTAHPALTSLSLARNHLGVGCCDALATFLGKSTCIQRLDVSNNELTDGGGVGIARALLPLRYGLGQQGPGSGQGATAPAGGGGGGNQSLQSLRAHHCDLGLQTAQVLLQALESHPCLTVLDVGANKIPFELLEQLGADARRRKVRWDATAWVRQRRLVQSLRTVEGRLGHTEREVAELVTLDAQMELDLDALEQGQEGWRTRELAVATSLRGEVDALIDEHRLLNAELLACEVDVKKRRWELEAQCELKRKERDAHRDARLQAEKQISKTLDLLQSMERDASSAFDECDRLRILLAAHEKKTVVLANQVHQDVARLAEWARALQTKMDRGEANPFAAATNSAEGGGSGGGAGATMATAAAASASSSGSRPHSPPPPPLPHAAASPAAASAATLTTSSAGPKSTPVSSPRHPKGTLLRPTAPLPDAMVWSAPLPPSTIAAATGANAKSKKKRKGKKKKKKASAADAESGDSAGMPTIFVTPPAP